MSKIKNFTDGLTSLFSGMGNSKFDKKETTKYKFNYADYLDDYELEAMYRLSWVAKKIVETKPKDAVRNWRDWQADKDQITALQLEEKRLGVREKVLEAAIKGNLFGGAAIYMHTKQDPEEPLDVNRVGKGGIEYLTVVTNTDLKPSDLQDDPTQPNFNKPTYYSISNSEEATKIHYTHLIVFLGNKLPDVRLSGRFSTGFTNNNSTYWADSTLQVAYTACRNADSTISNIASLVFEANVDVFGIPDFMDGLADKEYEDKMLRRFQLSNISKGINNAVLADKEDDYTRNQINFANLDKIIEKFLMICAAAAGIPFTKFMSTSAQGMNATGEGDKQNYYDDIKIVQSLEIEPAMALFDECLIRSSLGSRPDNIEFKWAPLEQLNDKEIADIGKITAETAKSLSETGLYPAEVLQEAVTNKLVNSGAFAGLDNILEQAANTEPETFGLEEDEQD